MAIIAPKPESPADISYNNNNNPLSVVTTSIPNNNNNNKPLKYPFAVFFIFLTEFCERFSYYGMRAVLTLYLRNVLNFSEDLSTTVYHVFLLLCYALPVLGGILADNYLGKYHTILYISIIYAIGNITLSVGAIPPLHLPVEVLTMLGLLLISIGTGGIKPCVVALGGEQFTLPAQAKLLGQFFAIFAFIVNVGSLISTTITPIFRRDVACFGDDTCYSLAFGMPASLMFFAIIVFVSGKSLYKLVPPHGNILVKVVKCITYATCKKLSSKADDNKNDNKKAHWLDAAKNKFDSKLITDTKGLTRILIYYVPIPMFWALYEQLGSRWTFQATRMNGVIGGITIKPDQMQVANSILMMTLIPLSETVIYPIFHKCGLLKRPLQRMGVGGMFAAFSFLLAGIVELQIQNSSFSNIASSGESSLNLVNTLPCPLILHSNYNNNNNHQPSDNNEPIINYNDSSIIEGIIIQPENNYIISSIHTTTSLSFSIQLLESSSKTDPAHVHHAHDKYSAACHDLIHRFNLTTNTKLNFTQYMFKDTESSIKSSLISIENGSISLTGLPGTDDLSKSKEANAKIRFVYNIWSPLGTKDEDAFGMKISLISSNNNKKTISLFAIPNDEDSGIVVSSTHEIEPDIYQISLETQNNTKLIMADSIELKNGGSYLYVVSNTNGEFQTNNNSSLSQKNLEVEFIVLTPPNEVHMLWLLPQYFVIACAEILFIISGMEFSFTEAPESMKSVLQSCWHLTNAMGNFIVILAAQFEVNEATGFFTFAGLMGIDTILFAWLASKYRYVGSPEQKLKQDREREKEKEEAAKLNNSNNIIIEETNL